MVQECFDWTDGPEDERRKSLDERFQDFHSAHPEVFQEFRRLAHQLRSRGHEHYGAKGIIEVLRFHHAIDGRPGEPWKLNNSYTSRYVRLLVESDPSFEGFFEMRVLKS